MRILNVKVNIKMNILIPYVGMKMIVLWMIDVNILIEISVTVLMMSIILIISSNV